MGEREERFARLFASAYGPLWAYARRRVPPDDVDDLVAETLTVAWRRLDDVPDPALPWLYGVAHKAIGNHLRSRRRGLRLVRRLAAEPAPVESADQARALDALGALRRADQEILRLTAWEDLSTSEIAVVLGCSPDAAAARLSRARKRFREHLSGSRPSRTQAGRKEIDV